MEGAAQNKFWATEPPAKKKPLGFELERYCSGPIIPPGLLAEINSDQNKATEEQKDDLHTPIPMPPPEPELRTSPDRSQKYIRKRFLTTFDSQTVRDLSRERIIVRELDDDDIRVKELASWMRYMAALLWSLGATSVVIFVCAKYGLKMDV